MGDISRMFDVEFRKQAVQRVRETGQPISQVAKELGISMTTLMSWVQMDEPVLDDVTPPTGDLIESERDELIRLRRCQSDWQRERLELEQERDALKRSLILWVREARRR